MGETGITTETTGEEVQSEALSSIVRPKESIVVSSPESQEPDLRGGPKAIWYGRNYFLTEAKAMGDPAGNSSWATPQRRYDGLHQNHIPKM